MSILCCSDKGWVISHYDYFKSIYKNVSSSTGKQDLTYNKNLFRISSPFLRDQQAVKLVSAITSDRKSKNVRKRKFIVTEINDEVQLVQKALDILLNEARKLSHLQSIATPNDLLENNSTARKFANGFCDIQEKFKNEFGYFEGFNNMSRGRIISINHSQFVIPPNSNYVCCDINNFFIERSEKYDFILIDPPWSNKHVKRQKIISSHKGYEMMDNHSIAEIPINICLENTGLVAVWCTNSPKHIAAIKEDYFPKWGLKYAATWFWLKVTESGEPICSFDCRNGKRPYERIIFGAATNRLLKTPDEFKCILSVPNALHSHKPPITELIKSFLPEKAKSLELFARYLIPGWTSVGNEVILLNSRYLFEELNLS